MFALALLLKPSQARESFFQVLTGGKNQEVFYILMSTISFILCEVHKPTTLYKFSCRTFRQVQDVSKLKKLQAVCDHFLNGPNY